MAMIRPSGTLVLDLDERIATTDTTLEIKRDYSHIGTPIIRTHAPESEEEDAPQHNTMRLLVKLGTRSYLYSKDEGADELWDEVVQPWIKNMLRKVGNNMKVFNDRQRKIGNPELVFERMTIEMQGGAFVVALHPDPECLVDPELAAQVGLARQLLNDETFAGCVRVDMPPEDDYETQRAQAWEPWIAEHPEPEPEEEEPEEVAEPEPEKTREQLLAEDIEAKSYENTAVPPTDSDMLPPIEREPEPEEPERFNFSVDYHLWKISYEDGSSKLFDSQSRSFLA